MGRVRPQPSKACPGAPLKFTSIIALSGPLGSAGGDRARTGIQVAVDGINRTCALGRPLQVNICDDQDDTNANLACGRKAASDGSLAILGSIGSFDGGVTASKLPAIFVNGTSPFELTNKNAYSSVNGIALGISGTSAIKALGKKSSTLLLPDTPTLQFAGQLIAKIAGQLNVKVDPIYYPQDTTDFAPVAAQVSQANDEAVGMLPLNPVVVVNALAQEGITPENHDMVIPGGVITPETLKEMGDAANGILVVSETMPPTETTNKGIAEFRADMKADGKNPDDPNVDFSDVTSWSNVKKLEGALLAAGPSVIKSLDSKSVVAAVVNHPVDRPETAAVRLPPERNPRGARARRLPCVHAHRRGAPDREREVQRAEQRLHRHPEAAPPHSCRRVKVGMKQCARGEPGAGDQERALAGRCSRGRGRRLPDRPAQCEPAAVARDPGAPLAAPAAIGVARRHVGDLARRVAHCRSPGCERPSAEPSCKRRARATRWWPTSTCCSSRRRSPAPPMPTIGCGRWSARSGFGPAPRSRSSRERNGPTARSPG